MTEGGPSLDPPWTSQPRRTSGPTRTSSRGGNKGSSHTYLARQPSNQRCKRNGSVGDGVSTPCTEGPRLAHPYSSRQRQSASQAQPEARVHARTAHHTVWVQSTAGWSRLWLLEPLPPEFPAESPGVARSCARRARTRSQVAVIAQELSGNPRRARPHLLNLAAVRPVHFVPRTRLNHSRTSHHPAEGTGQLETREIAGSAPSTHAPEPSTPHYATNENHRRDRGLDRRLRHGETMQHRSRSPFLLPRSYGLPRAPVGTLLPEVHPMSRVHVLHHVGHLAGVVNASSRQAGVALIDATRDGVRQIRSKPPMLAPKAGLDRTRVSNECTPKRRLC